jgi:uncharacterized protein YndB with AHSA1/START domain
VTSDQEHFDDASRVIDITVDVDASPEQVWEAIATGPGVTAWLQPTEIEPVEGGRYAFDLALGDGPNDTGHVAAYDRPYRFATSGVRWAPPGDAEPALLATEWIVTPRDGGGATVRMVMSGFGTGASWDDELDAMGQGMRAALDLLRQHLADPAHREGH